MEFLHEVLGRSPALAALRDQAQRLLASPGRRYPPVLLLGETGSGKGLLARALHDASARAAAPFVDLNCAAIPAGLLESELFGFERGAFTGAVQPKEGLVQTARGGTLFLDEIAVLPAVLQAKLLKLLDSHEVRRLGGTRTEPVDMWVISATNEDLPSAVASGAFREDLYHRLATVTLRLPPLRERGDDVLLLAEHFLSRACAEHRLPSRTLSADARAALMAHSWPGNVRQLVNALERAALLAAGPVLTAAELDLHAVPGRPPAGAAAAHGAVRLRESVDGLERARLLETLQQTGWNLSHAADRLGMSRGTLRYRIERLGLEAPVGPRPRRVRTPADSTRAVPDAAAPSPRDFVVLHSSMREGDARGAAHFVASAREQVQRFRGVVLTVTTRSVTAVFGLEPAEDAARRAVQCALALEVAVSDSHAARGPAVGSVVDRAVLDLGERGLPRRAPSPVVATLDRLARTAAPAQVLVTAAATALLDRWFTLEPLGKVAGTLVHALGRWQEPAGREERITAQLVGRRRELRLLQNIWRRVEAGSGQVVGVIGEPGAGKSRLVREARRLLGGGAATWLEARCVSHGSGTPLLPIVEMLRGTWSSGDEARASEALRELLLPPGTGSGVLAVEDLHWADPATEALLASLVDMLPSRPALLLVTYRPGYRPPWMDRSTTSQISLSPLDEQEARELVRSLAAGRDFEADTTQHIVQRACGNALFLEELTWQAVLHGGRLPADDDVPLIVHEVLRAWIERLTPPARRVLLAAAAVGREAALPLLEAVCEDAVRHPEALRELTRAELLHERAARGDRVYVFRHALTREVALRLLSEDERRRLELALAGTPRAARAGSPSGE